MTIPTLGGVTLAPHDAAWAIVNGRKVEVVQGTLGITGGLVVHIGVSKGAASDSITAHTNGSNGANLAEGIEEVGLGNL